MWETRQANVNMHSNLNLSVNIITVLQKKVFMFTNVGQIF